MPEAKEHMTSRLHQEGEKVLAYYRELVPDQWDHPVYLAGSAWNVRRLLAHFVSAERGFHKLFADILAGGAGAPEGFDIDQFNESEVGAFYDLDAQTLLDAFRDTRKESIRLIEQMTPADLERRGRHPWFGVVAVGDMVKLIYRHNQIHLRDIRKVLATGEPLAAEAGT
jgi:uncharacterized damage-inducible protein DinB